MSEFGRMFLAVGLLFIVIGALLVFAGKTGLPLGRLPGDFSYRGSRGSFFFPLTTSLLLSGLLSLIFYVIGRIRR